MVDTAGYADHIERFESLYNGRSWLMKITYQIYQLLLTSLKSVEEASLCFISLIFNSLKIAKYLFSVLFQICGEVVKY